MILDNNHAEPLASFQNGNNSDWCNNCNRRKALFDIVGLTVKIVNKA